MKPGKRTVFQMAVLCAALCACLPLGLATATNRSERVNAITEKRNNAAMIQSCVAAVLNAERPFHSYTGPGESPAEETTAWNLSQPTAENLRDSFIRLPENPIEKIKLPLTEDEDGTYADLVKSFHPQNGRLLYAERPERASFTYSYGGGKLTGLTCMGQESEKGISQTYSFSYDPFGRLCAARIGGFELGAVTFHARGGLPASSSLGKQNTAQYRYDPLGRLSGVSFSGEVDPDLTIQYGSNDQVLRIRNRAEECTYTYGYGEADQIKTVTEAHEQRTVQITSIGYDQSGRVSRILCRYTQPQAKELGREQLTRFYYLESGLLKSAYLPEGSKLSFQYDSDKCMVAREAEIGGKLLLERHFSFAEGNYLQIPRVEEIRNTLNGKTLSAYQLSFDERGNLQEEQGNEVHTYCYDACNQLISETGVDGTATYQYDSFGNIREIRSGEVSVVLSYDNEGWRDLLTGYNGRKIEYDEIGNPVKWYDGSEMTWTRGRYLSSIYQEKTGKTVSFQYDALGRRMSKSDGNYLHRYVWQGDKLLAESYGSLFLEYFYDESGRPFCFSFGYIGDGQRAKYYYVTDARGSITEILDEKGYAVAFYSYNAWGKTITCSGDLAKINPFRFKGYYYDQETALYYIDSRYYSPEICRFISASEAMDFTQHPFGTNLFVFEENNPVSVAVSCSSLMAGVAEEEPAREENAEAPRPARQLTPLTEEQKVFIATVYSEAGFNAYGIPAKPIIRQNLANIIMNRVGKAEWSEYKTVTEICENTGFYGFEGENYQYCMDYLNNRDGWNFFIEEIIDQVLPIYNKEVEDISGGAQFFYTPAAMNPPGSEPNWNFYILEELFFPGVDPEYDGRFFKYK